MFSTKTLLQILINTLIGVVLIFIWLQFIDGSKLLDTLKKVDLKYTLVFFILYASSSVVRALRLKVILDEFKIPWKNLIFLNFLSQLLSFFIPIRAGEISKSVYLNTQYSLPLGKTIIWILIDRFFDFWFALAAIGILINFTSSKLPSNFTQILVIILGIFTLVSILVITQVNFFKKLLRLLSSLFFLKILKNKFLSFSFNILDGFAVLRKNPWQILSLLGLTAFAFLLDGLIWLFLFLAFGLNITLIQAYLGNLLSALTFLIPSAPGYIGSAEASALAIFSGILGLNSNIVAASTVLGHILTTLALLILGIGAIYFLKFDLGLVWKKMLKRG
ncbi:flippase-like domain-containing protein [Candidatus Daviesbacteria bacterium]|nr:flippase-like domain-containing protein [Candidatus Daviesbacteria bacterium]